MNHLPSSGVPEDLSGSPVLALEGNVLWQFENVSPYAARKLKAQVADGSVSHEIWLDVSATSPVPPRVEQVGSLPPVMHLQVAYLELLWAFIYGWMVLFEEGVQKQMLDPAHVPLADLLARAELLLRWIQGQRDGYHAWPSGLPSPSCYASESERYYGEKANLVFQKATAFLLNHERAHAVLGHLEVLKQGASTDVWLELEREADTAALQELLSHGTDDKEKSAEAWAMLSVLLCGFYMYREPRAALMSGKHPPLHHRVGRVVAELALKSPKYDHYFKLLCRLVLQGVFPDVLQLRERFEDADDAFRDALDRLDDLETGLG